MSIANHSSNVSFMPQKNLPNVIEASSLASQDY
jgi:hypothetical protein